jgi:hypothetical protein
MAQFDPSTIQDIGAGAASFDPAADTQKALTLADLYDQNKLNKIKVADATQNQQDMTYAKQILQGKDLSKLDDQNAAVAKITQRNPQLGMELMRSFSGQRQDQNAEKEQQLKLYDHKNDIIGGAMYQLKAKHDQLLQQGMNEQQIHDAMKGDVMTTIKGLVEAKTPDGKPLLDQNDAKIMQQGFGQGYNTGFVDQAVSRSAQAKAAIAQKFKELDEQRKTKDEDRKEKATNAAIAAGTRRGDQADRRLTDQEQAAKAKRAVAEGGKLEPDDATALAEQYLAGDKSVMTGLGRGAQGAENIILVRHAIAREAKAQGMKPADIAARLAEYQGYTAEQRSLGTQQANVEMASSEAQQMIQNARGASDDTAVARAHSLGWNKIDQWSDKQLQGPENAKLASLKAATTAVINTWSRAINPKGVATVSDKEHGYELLNAAQDKATYDAVLDRFQQETEASLAAPASAKQRLHDAFISGQTPTPAAAPTAASLQPTPGRDAPPGGGPAAIPKPGATPGPTATGPDGKKVQWNGTAWVPVGG